MRMEHRFPYDVLQNKKQKHSAERVLLLPLFQSVQNQEDDPCTPCLHLVRLPDTRLSLCNVLTEQTCACCNCPTCEKHLSGQWIALPDRQGTWSEEHTALLCETCVLLPKETIYALQAFRVSINTARKRTPSVSQNMSLSHPIKEQKEQQA